MKPTGLFPGLFCVAAAIVSATRAGASPYLKRAEGPTVPKSFIVVLNKDADRTAHVSSFLGMIDSIADDITADIKRKYTVLNGYSGIFDDAAINKLLNDSSVAYIEPDYIASTSYTISPFQKRSSSPARGPARPSRRDLGNVFCGVLDICPDTSGLDDGSGVDIYGLDTGIYIEHDDFGGRAIHGPAFGPYDSSDDGNGHGTHTASIAAGTQYGVAPGASLIGVKVLGDDGTGAYSDIIAGIDWVVQQSQSSGRPSVINLSLGGPESDAMNGAVQSAVDAGVHVVAAAGNSATDASAQSPASEQSIITVGAVDSNNEIAWFSNYGPVVDVFALGVNVRAAFIGGPSETRQLSGTSMSSPAVAGILAVELAKYGWADPQDLQNSLKGNAQHAVTGQPEGTTDLLATIW